jgi:hypothetical protein
MSQIENKVFQSTHLLSASYSPDSKTLAVTFTNGRSYYSTAPVEPKQWEELCKAGSPGNYFAVNIKPNWKGEEKISNAND